MSAPRKTSCGSTSPSARGQENLYLAGWTAAMLGEPHFTAISSRPQNPCYPEYLNKPCRSFPASPHRASQLRHRHSILHQLRFTLSDKMIAKFSQSFQRWSVSRPSTHPPHPRLPLLPIPSPSPSLLQDGNMLFYHQQLRVNFWYPMSSSKYTAVPVHRFQARGVVLLHQAVHVACYLSPATVKRKGPSTTPQYCQWLAANDQPSRVSHTFFLPTCDINISTARSWSYDNLNLRHTLSCNCHRRRSSRCRSK
jgi:hypothetical protein